MANNSFTPSAPNQILWIIAVVVGLLGILGSMVQVAVISENNVLMVTVGFLLLFIGTALKGI